MKYTDLRTEFSTETKTRFNVEWVVYNDYVEWLEKKLIKLLTIPHISNNEMAVCHKPSHVICCLKQNGLCTEDINDCQYRLI